MSPKPKAEDIATSTAASHATFGMQSAAHAGSGVSWLIVRGSTPVRSDWIAKIASAAPAAPSMCPVIDSVDDSGGGASA